VKAKREDQFTRIYRDLQKSELTQRLARTYQPKDDTGEKLPSESKKVQLRVEDAFADITEAMSQIFNLAAVKDATNCNAKADVVVDGEKIVSGVPATHLLWVEKKLASIADAITKAPVLSQDVVWTKRRRSGLVSLRGRRDSEDEENRRAQDCDLTNQGAPKTARSCCSRGSKNFNRPSRWHEKKPTRRPWSSWRPRSSSSESLLPHLMSPSLRSTSSRLRLNFRLMFSRWRRAGGSNPRTGQLLRPGSSVERAPLKENAQWCRSKLRLSVTSR